jgi:ABC-type antimicrobial peptide transport system permease subunit
MKKGFLVLGLSLSLGLTSFGLTAKENKMVQLISVEDNQKIYNAVKNELTSFLEIVPVNMEKEHGFNNRSEFAKAVPASIYRMVGVDPYGKLIPTNNYNVVVSVNGEYRSVITVTVTNGTYELMSIGGALLAKELQAAEAANPLAGDQERVMVNVYKYSASFISTISANTAIENADLIPLESAKMGLENIEAGRSAKPVYKLSEAFDALANAH